MDLQFKNTKMGLDDELTNSSSSTMIGNLSSPNESEDTGILSEGSEENIGLNAPSSKDDFQASLAEFEKNLPHTVEILTVPTGAKVYLVGTAHFSPESQDDVSVVIQAVRPHIVMLELCQHRMSILQMDEETIKREAEDISFEKIKCMIKDHGVFQGLMNILILNLTAQLTKDLGVAPGGEFRRALAEVKKLKKCVIHFGDRPINVTLKRALSVLSWWQSIRLFCILLFTKQTIRKEEVENCKQRDLLESMLAEMAGEFPDFNRVFVQERDIVLTNALQSAAYADPNYLYNRAPADTEIIDEAPRVVGIVGIGHMSGISNLWLKVSPDMVPPLMRIPPPSRSSKVIKAVFKWSFAGLIVYGCYKLVPVPKTVSNTFKSITVAAWPLALKSIGSLKLR
ncbi:traB domain-containing protein isoform X2 [Nilaparvata lugens]|uniref:traB domain-containing protein isoform X2 n=2 Tax=Nilaparvata lugens TaxID=108931 RepID=UPI00193D5684|nr:traB domain-containing protein isoform X2 [Nilaparvata lugens]